MQVLTLTYEYKIESTTEQVKVIELYLKICCKVWNYALSEGKDWLNYHKSNVKICPLVSEYVLPAQAVDSNYKKQAKSLIKTRTTNTKIKSINAQVLQQFLRKLEVAFIDMKHKIMRFPGTRKSKKRFLDFLLSA